MAFDTKGFMEKRMIPREDWVSVPDMKDFFPNVGNEKIAFKVRGLTGQELGRANASAEKNRELKAVLDGMLSGSSKKITEAVRKLAQPDVSQDIAKRLELFVLGCVEPAGDLELAIKVCTVFPVDFYTITTKILELTGKGHVAGEPKPSGKTQKSEQR